MDQMFIEMVSTATIAIALFGVAFSLLQKKHRNVHRSFAAFLVAVAVANVPDAFDRLMSEMPRDRFQLLMSFLWVTSGLCLAPLFWSYVCALTSETQRCPPRLHRHFALAALAALVGLIVVVLPPEMVAFFIEDNPAPVSGWMLALVLPVAVILILVQVAVYPQMAIYLFLIVRRMMRYRLVLRDYYASTEEHELRWIYVIGALGWLYWTIQSLLFLFFALDPDASEMSPTFIVIAGLASLTLVASMTLWGLRQQPPLIPTIGDDGSPGTGNPASPDESGPKYEKSALSAEMSSRIARKLRAAMEQDHLHRDPNLSLWALARHVGASPNYVTQTLSEVIGESFFDFVNGYRIAEAQALLSTTDDTVLAITYEVGFNARSSFYNAFKRVTGQTPTSYRKTLSVPAEMDDASGRLLDT
ncbi:hypothetical protein GCM10007385_29220 [Tateyamaria omphalii]|uniref:helix-turn-helix domain-containing protein n=1 Tax=Tateyamaria omphalii TaxID=299262 RepID=UPI00167B959D|nr:AraC family transcriptional regulator [Tateyamaria omphalii]GGX58608.1 hypothetical protein GCM10007385_29220 [Tateyamaria omphalii]